MGAPEQHQQAPRKARKRVYVGDASRRWSLAMPPSLANFQCRVRRAYKLPEGAPLDIWLHPRAHGKKPAYGSELVSTESEWRCITDDDVLVIVSGGRTLTPNKALLAEFDFETTYKSDYTPKSLKPRTPAFVGIRWQHKHDFEVPNQYETTYKRDYVEKTPSWKERRPYRPMDWEKKPFVGQTQYQRDYVKKVLDVTDHTAPEPELLRKWRPSSAPVPRRKESTSKTDFVGYVVRPLEMPNKTYAAIVPKGPAWLPTEYNHELYKIRLSFVVVCSSL